MIKIDKEKFGMEGDAVTIMNEAALVLTQVSEYIAKNTPYSPEKVLSDILDIQTTQSLIAKGMSPKEAVDIIMPGKISQVVEVANGKQTVHAV